MVVGYPDFANTWRGGGTQILPTLVSLTKLKKPPPLVMFSEWSLTNGMEILSLMNCKSLDKGRILEVSSGHELLHLRRVVSISVNHTHT